jgi:hypothetical protein
MTQELRNHAYAPPFDTDRSGTPLVQRNEEFVESSAKAARWRSVSLFAVSPVACPVWEESGDGWRVNNDGMTYEVALTDTHLHVGEYGNGTGWDVVLPTGD